MLLLISRQLGRNVSDTTVPETGFNQTIDYRGHKF